MVIMAAAAILISAPAALPVRERFSGMPPPSSPVPSTSTSSKAEPANQIHKPKTFKRLKSSLEQSLRTTTMGRAKAGKEREKEKGKEEYDEMGTVRVGDAKGKGKERERERERDDGSGRAENRTKEREERGEKEKTRSGMMQSMSVSMLSRVSFRRSQPSPVPPPPPPPRGTAVEQDRDKDKDRDKDRRDIREREREREREKEKEHAARRSGEAAAGLTRDRDRERERGRGKEKHAGGASRVAAAAGLPLAALADAAAAVVAHGHGQGQRHEEGQGRFEAPSLRQASMSSPVLPLASQAFGAVYAVGGGKRKGAVSVVDVSRVREKDTLREREQQRDTHTHTQREKERETQREREGRKGTISTSQISGPVPLGTRPRGSSVTTASPTTTTTATITAATTTTTSTANATTTTGTGETQPQVQRTRYRPPPLSTSLANASSGVRERASLDSAHARSPVPSSPLSPNGGTLARGAPVSPSASTSHLPLRPPRAGLSQVVSSPAPGAPSSTPAVTLQIATPTTPTSPTVLPVRRTSLDAPHRTFAGTAAAANRETSPKPIRRSIDRRTAGSPPSPAPSSRAASPASITSSSLRPRLSPTPAKRSFSPTAAAFQARASPLPLIGNGSTASLSLSQTQMQAQAMPEQREALRTAATMLIREVLRPSHVVGSASATSLSLSGGGGVNGIDAKEYEECERRLAALARLERVWGRSGSQFTSKDGSGTAGSAGGGTSGMSAAGEERERRYFSEALRDGYVLCQLINKLHPGFIARIDKREDGFIRTSNVTKFLAASSSLGVPKDEIFHRDDLIEVTPESLARVARNVIALLHVSEFPPEARAKVVHGQGQKSGGVGGAGLYGSMRAAASTPNLSSVQRSASPPALSSPKGRKRVSPPLPSLPTVRSDSPNESDSEGSKATGAVARGDVGKQGRNHDEDDVPDIITPPPRSPLRPRASVERASVADSTRASIGDSVRASFADSFTIVSPPPLLSARQSLASSHMSDTTMMSSLFDARRSRRNSDQTSRFGTLRTVATEATSFVPSEHPSWSGEGAKAAANEVVDELGRRRSGDGGRPVRERRPSETAIVDLMRVVEENEESSASAKASRSGKDREKGEKAQEKAEGTAPMAIPERSKASQIRLGKGKWPDDFMDAFGAQQSTASLILDEDDSLAPSLAPSPVPTPLSVSPQRKLSFVGVSRGTESVESLPQFPRRPTHRARHSVDTTGPGLLPRDPLRPRDSSPDGSISPPRKIMLRRTSTTRTGTSTSTSVNRNGIYIPRGDSDESPAPGSPTTDGDASVSVPVPVPFPRSVSGEYSTPPQVVHFPPELDKVPSMGSGTSSEERERPRLPRGRFQSEVDGASARRRPRPQSYDDAGAKPRRSRYESMVSLGAVGPANASASDLMHRPEGNAVRQTLIVRDDGKPAMQFQLGNCIGRGQFGAVYRALNLNTGQMVAVKRISLEGLKEEEIAQLMNEVDLVKSLSHPSIVKYEGMARDDNTLNIVLEYAENGSLAHTLKAFGKLNERLIASYVVKILEGLHYLHQSDVVHCDLKAANILTTKNGNVKLSDFGVSLNLRAMEREIKDVAGTPNWMAPEVIELKGASPKSDVWSLGCTVIELLTGRPPYSDIANTMSVMFRIVEDDAPPIPDGCSPPLKDFLRQCLQKDPTKRPTAELLCEHRWLKKNWGAHNDLRPQDSIPFLRRVSADLQKSEAIKYLSKIEMAEPERLTPDLTSASPPRRRLSSDMETISPREHSFVKTTFSKPVICRVCNENVKRSAVLCEQCSLIAHGRCAGHAAPTCDLRSQLLLYAEYAELGTPSSLYSNPREFLSAHTGSGTPTTPLSDAGMSSRTSVDASVHSSPRSTSATPIHPPTAFKGVISAITHSRSFYNNRNHSSPEQPSSSTSSQPQRALSRKTSILRRNSRPPPPPRERPSSIASSSPPSSSLRSAATAAESFSTRPDTVRQSTISIVETDVSTGERTDRRLSRMTSYSGVSFVSAEEARSSMIPGDLPRGTIRDKRHDSKSEKGGCVVQ